MKFDVPLSTPAISHASATSGRRESDPRNGTPASTAASKANTVRRRTRERSKSAPAEATSVLFAVTTGIPLSRARTRRAAGRLERRRALRRSRRRRVVTTFAASVVEPEPRPRSPLATIAHQRVRTQRRPVFAASSCARRCSATSATAWPTRPYPSKPDAYHARRRSPPAHRIGRFRPATSARSFTSADFALHALQRHTSPFPALAHFENGSATTTRRSARAAAGTRLRNAIYRGNEECCRLRRNRPRFIFPGIGQEVAPGRLPPGCCGVVGPVPSATRDKCLRHAQT